MANNKSALKSSITDIEKHNRNRAIKANVRTVAKNVLSAVENNKAEDAKTALATAVRTIDKACSKGVIHKNNAARKKSRLTVKVNSIAK